MACETTNISQYCQSHSYVGVMFAVIPELKLLDMNESGEKDREMQLSKLVHLQTLLCEIDTNLQNERFSSLEKIKGGVVVI